MTVKPATRDRLDVARRQIAAVAAAAPTPADMAAFIELMNAGTHTRSDRPVYGCAADTQEDPR